VGRSTGRSTDCKSPRPLFVSVDQTVDRYTLCLQSASYPVDQAVDYPSGSGLSSFSLVVDRPTGCSFLLLTGLFSILPGRPGLLPGPLINFGLCFRSSASVPPSKELALEFLSNWWHRDISEDTTFVDSGGWNRPHDNSLTLPSSTYMLSLPLWIASTSCRHDLPRRIWHLSISTTSQATGSR